MLPILGILLNLSDPGTIKRGASTERNLDDEPHEIQVPPKTLPLLLLPVNLPVALSKIICHSERSEESL